LLGIAPIPFHPLRHLCPRGDGVIAAVIAALPVRSCVIDGEAIACDENGLAVFNLLRYRRRDQAVVLCAFDLRDNDRWTGYRRTGSEATSLRWSSNRQTATPIST
jgi:hypothetical protein